jgi:hypothetical protein
LYLTLLGQPTNPDSNDPYEAVGIGFALRVLGHDKTRYDQFVLNEVYFLGIRFVHLEG